MHRRLLQFFVPHCSRVQRFKSLRWEKEGARTSRVHLPPRASACPLSAYRVLLTYHISIEALFWERRIQVDRQVISRSLSTRPVSGVPPQWKSRRLRRRPLRRMLLDQCPLMPSWQPTSKRLRRNGQADRNQVGGVDAQNTDCQRVRLVPLGARSRPKGRAYPVPLGVRKGTVGERMFSSTT